MNLSEIGELCADTPRMTVFDPRRLTVRTVDFNRKNSTDIPDALITCYQYGKRGEMQMCTDPRFSASAPENEHGYQNLVSATDLLQRPVHQVSIDSGESLSLLHADGQPEWITKNPGEGVVSQRFTYDRTGRLLSLRSLDGTKEILLQTRRYSDGDDNAEEYNCRGQCTEIQNGAGTETFTEFDISGKNKTFSRRFWSVRDQSADLNHPPEAETRMWINRNDLSASGSVRQLSLSCHEAEQERSVYIRRNGYNRRGQLISSHLTDEGGNLHALLVSADYHANGACQQEMLGNGVTRYYAQEHFTKRLLRISTWRPGGNKKRYPIQDISYQYDPAGNVTERYDLGREDQYFDNLRITAHNQYHYDSCYRLRRAAGREALNGGKNTITPLVSGSHQLVNYQRWYDYDNAGNMTQLRHSAGQNNWTQVFSVSPESNRSLPQPVSPYEVERFFDSFGNLKESNGVHFTRDSQQQLVRADGARRANGASDYEFYQYDSSGQRCSKLSSRIADGITQARRRETVTYISGMRLCEYDYDGKPQGSHYSLSFPLAGHSAVVCLSEREPEKKEIPLSLMRYNCLDAQGSVALELSAEGDIITQEEYYPFGGTSLFSSRSESEADYKYHRYSNKERDNLTGLYDYGFRYYAPWLCRWISPDPLGIADGLNAYSMVHNNPATYSDSAGLMAWGEEFEMQESRALPGYQRIASPVCNTTTVPVPQKSIGDRLRSAGRVLSRPLTAIAQGIARIGRAIRSVISGIRSALQRLRGTGNGAEDLEMQPLLAMETESDDFSGSVRITESVLTYSPENNEEELAWDSFSRENYGEWESDGEPGYFWDKSDFAIDYGSEAGTDEIFSIGGLDENDYEDDQLSDYSWDDISLGSESDFEEDNANYAYNDTTPLLSGINNAAVPAAISSLALSATIFSVLWWYQSQHSYRR
ncbi:RHS repeat domain-containing protein [Morganella morganii]|uniref:RHS repeat domain-containing protein n=1 Tax=Morganella morganii TaxID=582 RepID=UPI001BDA5BFB|nr:RHS repeat-associated core domain-containing protein [Morganella morganii]ELT0454162.1 RHS repeat-associated core domain-containing protein [Morganella morganii]MBT0338110.1 RHS repeat-associated core domain-containing protein [Morganella morganii subsp. morganii]